MLKKTDFARYLIESEQKMIRKNQLSMNNLLSFHKSECVETEHSILLIFILIIEMGLVENE